METIPETDWEVYSTSRRLISTLAAALRFPFLAEEAVAVVPDWWKKVFNLPSSDRKSQMPIISSSAAVIQFVVFVYRLEVTAIPEMSLREAIQQDVAVEASHSEDYQEYEIFGLTADHFADRAKKPLFSSPFTIVKLDRVTVTASTTITSAYPNSKDRVTLAYYGCVPQDAPSNLPPC